MNKKIVLDETRRTIIVIVSSAIYALGVVWFLEPAHLYAAGVTGVAQIIHNLFEFIKVDINLGILSFILNIPLFFIGYRNVSKRFAFYSIVSVVVQSILLSGIIPTFDYGLSPTGNELTLSIVGGLITGFGCGVALKYGTSTGGLDILAQAYAFKKNVSIGTFTLAINILIAIVGGGLVEGRWAITLYTFIRIIISSVVIDKIHTIYNYATLNIITNNSQEIADKVLLEMKRGCTIFNVTGAYTHESKFDLFIVVSSYEIDKALKLCKEIDPQVFVVVSPVKKIFGNYSKRSIV